MAKITNLVFLLGNCVGDCSKVTFYILPRIGELRYKRDVDWGMRGIPLETAFVFNQKI
jgi:hypothetical protein